MEKDGGMKNDTVEKGRGSTPKERDYEKETSLSLSDPQKGEKRI